MILPRVKAHLEPAVKSPTGHLEALEESRAEYPQVRRDWELRLGRQAERPRAPRGLGCQKVPDQDERAEVPDWAHRVAVVLGWACRT